MKSALALSLIALLAIAALPARAQTGTGTNFETRLSTLEDQMRSLNGQLEQINFAIRRMDQNVQRMQGDYDARLQKLESGPQQQVAAPSAAQQAQQPVEINGTLGALKMQQDGRVTGGVVNPQAPPLPEAPADFGLTPQEQYDRAFGLLRQANYDEAEKAFKGFIEKNPKDKLTDNAKYWYAETLYVRGHFDTAAAAFADAYQQNPQGTKAPDSLLKLAKSLAAIEKVPDACIALAQLKSNYPNASANVKALATQERSQLKCGTL